VLIQCQSRYVSSLQHSTRQDFTSDSSIERIDLADFFTFSFGLTGLFLTYSTACLYRSGWFLSYLLRTNWPLSDSSGANGRRRANRRMVPSGTGFKSRSRKPQKVELAGQISIVKSLQKHIAPEVWAASVLLRFSTDFSL